MRSRGLAPAAVLATTLVLATCSDLTEITTPPDAGLRPAASLASAPTEFCGVATTATLVADETIDVGQVTIINDETSLYVTFSTDAAWPIGRTAVFVSADPAAIPTSGGGNPQIGRFPYKASHDAGLHEVTWKIPLDEVGAATAVVAAFAEVGADAEGAWGAGTQINESAGWASYSTHAIQECGRATIDDQGGTVGSAIGGVQLVILEGALKYETEISFEPASSTNPNAIPNTVFDFGPDGLEFDDPAMLTLPYDPDALPDGVDESQIRPFMQDDSGFEIIPGFVIDPVAKTVKFPVEHFTFFGLLFVDQVDLAVSALSAAPDPARVGEDVTIDVEVRHTGGPTTEVVSDADVTITLLDPAGLSRQFLSPNCDQVGDIVPEGVQFNCSTGPLGAGDVAAFQLVVRGMAGAANQAYTVRAHVAPTGESGIEDPVAANDFREIEFEILPDVAADLRISGIGFSPGAGVKAGQPMLLHGTAQSKAASIDPITAKIRFDVDGGATAMQVIADDLPAGCTFVSALSSTVITCDVGTVNPGASVLRSVPVVPLQDRVYNVLVTALPVDGDPTPDDNDVPFSFTAQPTVLDLAVIDFDRSIDEIDVGGAVVFSARVLNLPTSPDMLFAGTLRLEVDGDAQFVNATAGCEDVSDFVIGRSVAINCPLSMLNPGEATDLFHLALEATSPDQTLTGEARLLLADYVQDQDLSNNTASLPVRVRAENEVDYRLTAFTESVDPAKPFQPLTYSGTVQLAAASAGAATGGEYRLFIEGDVALTSTPAGCSTLPLFPAGFDVRCPLGTLASGAAKDFDIVLEPQRAPQQIEATASIIAPADATETAPGDEQSSHTTDVVPLQADLWLTLIGDSPDPVATGEIVTYEFFANSSGPDDVPRAVVQFRVDGDAELVSMPTGAIGVTCTDLSSASPLAVVVNCDIEPLRSGIASPRLAFEVRALSGPSVAAEAQITPIAATTVDPDPSDNLRAQSTTVDPPPSLAAAYVVNQRDNTVSVVDPSTNLVTATIPVTTNPFGAGITPDGSEVWVLHASRQIDVISTATNTVVGTFGVAMSGNLFDVAFTPDGATAVLTGNSGGGAQSIAFVDVATRTLITVITTGVAEFPRFVDVLPNGTKAYVTASEAVMVIDLATNTVAKTIPIVGQGFDIAAAADGSAVYFANQPTTTSGLLREIDPATDALVGAGVAVGLDPLGVVLNAAGTEAYVSEERNRIYFVDLTAGTATSITTPIGSHPYRLDITGDGASLFVGFRDSDGLAEIDIASKSIVATTPVGDTPAGVVVKN